MNGQASAAAPTAEAGGGSRPTPERRAACFALDVLIAVSVLAAGTGMVGAGLAWAPSRGAVRAISRGAQLYAAECAGCHGGWLERWDTRAGPDVREPRAAPSLGKAGHAWRHSDAELAAVVIHGTGSVTPQGDTPGMPAFAERLGRSDIDAILAFIKSGWPRSARTYQAALSPGGEKAWAALLRDPAWTFPGQCLPPSAAIDRR